VVGHRLAGTADGARDAAEELGWPVVVKTATAGVDHKSDVGGVHLDLRDPDQLREAYDDIAARLGPEVLVSRMLPRTTELALGLVRDRQIGPVLVVAAGGTLVELLHDRQVALPPIDEGRARRLLERLTVWPLLDGARGRAPADVDAVAAAIRALSNLAEDLGGAIAALDVNPLLVGPDGCVAVDALVVPHEPQPEPAVPSP
jgi:acetate---CoA ligase (ADP-forming)